jgi:hypothetical protein
MFTLGTAFGAGIGGAVVALADAGTLQLPVALAMVNGLMAAVAVMGVVVATRVPHGPAARQAPPPSSAPAH